MLDIQSVKETFGNGNITEIRLQDGGLFNNLVFFQSNEKKYIFKQYMDQAKSEIYNIPNIPKEERYTLALDVQKIVSQLFHNHSNIKIPLIIRENESSTSFIMEFLNGQTFINFLEKGTFTENHIREIAYFLGKLHQESFLKFNEVKKLYNTKFRDFKLLLQYDGLEKFVDKKTFENIIKIKNKYISESYCILHSDLNSRNILIDSNKIVFIDFEQSHLGSPQYDLAYIFSEIYMSSIYHKKDAKRYMSIFLEEYFKEFNKLEKDTVVDSFMQHLGIQIIYRFFGPSKKHWSYYIDEKARQEIVEDSLIFINGE